MCLVSKYIRLCIYISFDYSCFNTAHLFTPRGANNTRAHTHTHTSRTMGDTSAPEMPSMLQPICLLTVAYLSRNYIDDKNEQHLLYVRLAFAFTSCIIILLNLYIYFLINAKKDKDEEEKVIKAKNPQTGKEETFKTNKEYDLSEFKKKRTSLIMNFCIICFVHYKWGVITPMCIQTILQPLNLLKSPLAKIYLLNEANVKRPFDDGSGNNPFLKMLKGMQDAQNTEKKKRRHEKVKKKTGAELRKEKRES